MNDNLALLLSALFGSCLVFGIIFTTAALAQINDYVAFFFAFITIILLMYFAYFYLPKKEKDGGNQG